MMSEKINQHVFITGYCHYCNFHDFYKESSGCVDSEDVYMFTTETGDPPVEEYDVVIDEL